MSRLSLTNRLFLRLLPALLFAALICWWLGGRLHQPVTAALGGLLLLLVLWLAVHHATAPLRSLLRALAGLTASYRDGEFNVGVHWQGQGEVGELVDAHRQLGEVLRQQRQDLVQRELLLDTMLQNTPVAMLLVASGGDGEQRVVFSNLAARKLLHGGWKLEGQRLATLIASLPDPLRVALDNDGDSVFAVPDADS
ncbi:MAG: ATP-binding protein, partial [Stenotrophomonas koreensis]